MLFLGRTFFRDNKCAQINPVNVNNISHIRLSGGIYDDLFITKDIYTDLDKIPLEWDFSTILHAAFRNDLLAGNLGFAIDTISSIRIKLREKGKFEWTTIYDIPISSIEDLSFIRNYPYCKGNTTYEFAMIPVLNETIEGNLNIIECTSDFDGVYLVDSQAALHMFLNFESTQQRNQNATVVNTLGRAKPFYITNGISNYDSGQINVTFIQMNDNCEFDIKNGAFYRKNIDNYLTDKRPKILKYKDGRMWIIGITDVISQSSDLFAPVHTISWNEIADCDNPYDMYLNGFLDTYIKEG